MPTTSPRGVDPSSAIEGVIMHRPTFITLGLVIGTAGFVGSAFSAPAAEAASDAETCHGKAATIVGTNGHDVLIGTPGDDVIVGLRGWDVLRGAGGEDTICGGRGSDHVYGGTGADWLDGQGDGLLFGEDQYGDYMNGGDGNDFVSGGDGLSSGDRGLDVLVYPTDVAPLRADLQTGTVFFDGHTDHVDNIEYVNGTNFADTLTGDGYFNFITGGGGNDTLVGNGGVDFLDGDDGNDLMKGGSGDDLLSGGAGTDAANGGDGDDYCNSSESWVACEHIF